MSKEYELQIVSNINKYTNNGCRIIQNEEPPYVLFSMTDLGKILNLRNIRENAVLDCDKIKINTQTTGGIQKMTYLTYNGLLKLITRSRKRSIYEFAHNIGIDVKGTLYLCFEAETTNCIFQTFKGEEIIEQYTVELYRLDLYLPRYKLAIECDEKQHTGNIHKNQDIIREERIKDILGCTFIRYKPYDNDFNIFELLNAIYKHIHTYR